MKKAFSTLALLGLLVLALQPLFNFLVQLWDILKGAGAEPAFLGQMGDFFGGHTAALSGLLSVALILYFSNEQAKSNAEQIKLSRRSSDLQALVNIYEHYGTTYGGGNDSSGILAAVAAGHRRWVVRESFSLMDPDAALEEHRRKQVNDDFNELIRLAGAINLSNAEVCKIANLTSSMLLDKRLQKTTRANLWSLYEVLRDDPLALSMTTTHLRAAFDRTRHELSRNHFPER